MQMRSIVLGVGRRVRIPGGEEATIVAYKRPLFTVKDDRGRECDVLPMDLQLLTEEWEYEINGVWLHESHPAVLKALCTLLESELAHPLRTPLRRVTDTDTSI